jgi:thiol-disulfide isomerase/thioredoxin
MIQTGQMRMIWGIINSMKTTSCFFLPILFLLLASCADVKESLMLKVDGGKYANFNLPNLKGKYISSNDFKGNYVLVNFWATWCAPCVKELPSLNSLNSEFSNSKNFKMVAINIGQNKEVVEKFFADKSTQINFTVLLDENMELSEWSVQAIPTTFLINDKGKIIYKVEGEKEWDSPEFVSFISSIIN